MSISVCRLSTKLEDGWSQLLAGHEEATFYHQLIWRTAVQRAFGHEPHYLLARRDGQVVGVLPLFLVHSSLAGPILVSLPYAVYGGILAEDDAAVQALFSAACDLLRRTSAGYLDLRSRRAVVPHLPIIDRYVTFIKPLPATAEQVLPSLPRKARAAARQARQRFGLTVDFDDQLLPAVWQLYARSMRRLGSLNYPLEFFSELIRLTPGQHLVQVVRYRQKPVAGLVCFIFRDTALPYFSGCDERYNFAGVNNYMYLMLMEKAVSMGLRRFDFGRSRKDNTGCVQFKRHQGFEPTALQYQAYVPPGQHDPQLHPGRTRYRLAGAVWRYLPLALTRSLGAWLSRAIPG